MTELKPCPFCGGATVTYVCEDGFNVSCSSANNCLARPFIIERTLEEAANIWNTRAAPRTDGDDGELVERTHEIARHLKGDYDGEFDNWADWIERAADRITALIADLKDAQEGQDLAKQEGISETLAQ